MRGRAATSATPSWAAAFTYWMDPLENWLLDIAGVSALARWVDVAPTAMTFSFLGKRLDWDQRPWEVEAEWLAH